MFEHYRNWFPHWSETKKMSIKQLPLNTQRIIVKKLNDSTHGLTDGNIMISVCG